MRVTKLAPPPTNITFTSLPLQLQNSSSDRQANLSSNVCLSPTFHFIFCVHCIVVMGQVYCVLGFRLFPRYFFMVPSSPSLRPKIPPLLKTKNGQKPRRWYRYTGFWAFDFFLCILSGCHHTTPTPNDIRDLGLLF